MRFVHNVILAYRLLIYFLTRTRPGRLLVFLSLPFALLAVLLWKPTYEPPIFDAQVHYDEEAWSRISVEAIMNTAEEINVPWLLVGSIPNEGTWRLHAADTGRVVPMLMPAMTKDDRLSWHLDDTMPGYVEDELVQRPYRGMGELFLFTEQVETAVVERVLELAVRHRLVLHTRSDPVAIQHIFTQQPSLRVLWAHAGVDVPADKVSQMLDYYPRLWIELSHRRSVAPGGKLDPAWRELLLRHPDRVLLGSGTYSSEYWHKFRVYMSDYRAWLKELPPAVAKKIAFQNGLALFEIKQ